MNPLADSWPQVDPQRCTGCGACVAACEREAVQLLHLDSGIKRAQVDPDRCSLNLDCVRACTHKAITWEG